MLSLGANAGQFELAYAPVNGQWRLFGLSVNLGSSAPRASAGAATPCSPGPIGEERWTPCGAESRAAQVAHARSRPTPGKSPERAFPEVLHTGLVNVQNQ